MDDFAFHVKELRQTVVQNEGTPPPELLDAADSFTSVLVEWVELAASAEQPFGRGQSKMDRWHLVRQADDERCDSNLDVLIELTMASFSGLAETRPGEAVAIAGRWRLLGSRPGHTIFTRLWLWAAANFNLLDATEALDFLVERPEILWAFEYEAEVLRFLRLRAARARRAAQARLGTALMRRPPAALLPEHIGARELQQHIMHERSLRLRKLALGGAALKGPAARLAATAANEWRERGVLEDVREVNRPVVHDVMASYSGKPDPQALIGRPAPEIVTAIRQCAEGCSQARLAESVAANEPNRAVEILQAMRLTGLGRAPSLQRCLLGSGFTGAKAGSDG